MPRHHAIEWMDQEWFPSEIRNQMTDFLQFLSNTLDIYAGAAPLIVEAMRTTGDTQIVDLASGGGGGFVRLAGHLQAAIPELQIKLSDYFPNTRAFESTVATRPDVFSYISESIDATDVPPDLKGFRTQFLSFHHFRPDMARKILQNAVDCGAGIGVFEIQKRNLFNAVLMAGLPSLVWASAAFIRPFRWERILFNYVVPVVPAVTAWDGMASVIRTYDAEEMQALVDSVAGSENYDWQIGEAGKLFLSVPYLIGVPKANT